MSHIHTIRLLIEGRVQGVGFRPFVCRAAKKTGLTGWVKNLGAWWKSGLPEEGRPFCAGKIIAGSALSHRGGGITKEELPLERFPDFSAVESSGEPLAPLFRRI